MESPSATEGGLRIIAWTIPCLRFTEALQEFHQWEDSFHQTVGAGNRGRCVLSAGLYDRRRKWFWRKLPLSVWWFLMSMIMWLMKGGLQHHGDNCYFFNSSLIVILVIGDCYQKVIIFHIGWHYCQRAGYSCGFRPGDAVEGHGFGGTGFLYGGKPGIWQHAAGAFILAFGMLTAFIDKTVGP